MSGTIKFLGIDSNYDNDTMIIYDYRNEKVYPYISQFTRNLELRQGRLATREKVEEVAIDPEIKFITGSGHGISSAFKGHMGEYIFKKKCPLLGKGYSKEEVMNKIIHFASCFTADTLGRDFVDKGSIAFFGYSHYFLYPDESHRHLLFDCDSQIDHSIAEGDSHATAYAKAVEYYQTTIDELIEDDRDDIAAQIRGNLDCFEYLY